MKFAKDPLFQHNQHGRDQQLEGSSLLGLDADSRSHRKWSTTWKSAADCGSHLYGDIPPTKLALDSHYKRLALSVPQETSRRQKPVQIWGTPTRKAHRSLPRIPKAARKHSVFPAFRMHTDHKKYSCITSVRYTNTGSRRDAFISAHIRRMI
jgi:hypothetical protein